MFPHDLFAADYFPGDYFPPAANLTPPAVGGAVPVRYRLPVPPDEPDPLADEDLFFALI